MTVFAWARNAADNAVQSVGGFKLNDLLPFRVFPAVAREIMAQVRRYADDQGGALRTSGTGNTYVVNTLSGLSEPRPGISLLVEVDRVNTDAVSASVDGQVRPWLDMSGALFPPGALQPRAILRMTWSEARGAWVSDVLGGLTVAALDVMMRLHWLSLPDDPRGIGPNAPYRNNGQVAWTSPTNPAFSIASPEGRRMYIMQLKEALPKSSDGLGPGEPYMNNGIMTFVPDDFVAPPEYAKDSPEGVRANLRAIRAGLPKSPEGLEPGDPYMNNNTIAFVPNPGE